MSLSSPEFRNLERAIINALNTNIRKQILDTRVQGYVLDERVILREMMHPDSPFRWPDAEGNKLERTEVKKLARRVSKDLYNEYKKIALTRNAINLTGKSVSSDFNSSPGINMGYDDKRRIIFYSAQGKNNYRSFTETVVSQVTKHVIATRKPTDPTRVLLEPNIEWVKLKNEYTSKIRAEGVAAGATKKSIEGKITRGLKKVREQAREDGVLDYEGLQAGHTFGASVSGAAFLLADRHDLAHTFHNNEELPVITSLPEANKAEIQELITKIIKVDANLRWERLFSTKGVTGRFTLLVPESATRNIASGGRTGDPIKLLRNILSKVDLVNLRGSPSYNELLAEYVERVFLEKPVNRRLHTTKKKLSFEERLKIPVSSIPTKKGRVKYNKPKAEQKGDNINLQKVITIVNDRLHDQIQKNMGKGRSKRILNYRTGRFARSAILQTLYPSHEKGVINAQVRYMKDPYQVFEKGGRLHLPLRDPKGIFGRSIRQILQEEKIASLRKVKVVTRG